MKLYQKEISELYESLKIQDYFSENFDEGKIEDFLSQKEFGIFSPLILEDFVAAYIDKPIPDGFEDLYQITLRNGKKFFLVIDYSTFEKSKDVINKRILTLNHKENTKILGNQYEQYLSDIDNGEMLALIQFKDETGNHKLTGDVGISSYELFSSLKEAIFDSFWNQGRVDNLKGFVIRVDNTEIKRLKLYQMLVNKFLKSSFPNMFVDSESESAQNITLLVVTK